VLPALVFPKCVEYSPYELQGCWRTQ